MTSTFGSIWSYSSESIFKSLSNSICEKKFPTLVCMRARTLLGLKAISADKFSAAISILATRISSYCCPCTKNGVKKQKRRSKKRLFNLIKVESVGDVHLLVNCPNKHVFRPVREQVFHRRYSLESFPWANQEPNGK